MRLACLALVLMVACDQHERAAPEPVATVPTAAPSRPAASAPSVVGEAPALADAPTPPVPPAPAADATPPARPARPTTTMHPRAAPAPPIDAAPPHLTYELEEATAFARARAEHKGVLVDFTAAWCMPCQELDRVLARADIAAAVAASFVVLRVDVTDETDATNATQERYGALALPNLVFLSATGKALARVDRLLDADALAAVVAGAAARADK
jgi:thiol-disulfide isomerase/thioredoxin